MLSQYSSGRGRRKSSCSGTSVYWIIIVALACVSAGSLYCLQSAYKENGNLKASVDTTEGRRRSLSEEVDLHKQKLAQAELKAEGASKERDELLVSRKSALAKLSEAQKNSSIAATLTTQMTGLETRLAASEREIKEITVKAGTCQQEFAALNAECATLKQGLANLGLTSQTTKPDTTRSATAGTLDPRGGTEAAKVLREHSQQGWKGGAGSGAVGQEGEESEASILSKATQEGGVSSSSAKNTQGASSRVLVRQPHLLHDGESDLAGTDIDETGPGLEKALAQGGAAR